MWAVNNIQKFTIITPDECTAKMPNAQLDSKKWITAIELAESRFVEPLLGWNLYFDIVNNKNVLVTTGNIGTLQPFFTSQFGTDPISGLPIVQLVAGQIVNSINLSTISAAYMNLWNQALYNYVFNCVWWCALPDNYASFNSSGIQKANPLDSGIGTVATQNVGISLSDLKYLQDNLLLNRISPLQTWLEKWLCANAASYPLYPIKRCQEKYNHDGSVKNRTTGLILDVYDDDCCDGWHRDGWGTSQNPNPPTPPPSPSYLSCSIMITIVATPDGTLYPLCNLQTIPAQYAPSATTLQLVNLIGKYVQANATYNGSPVTVGPTNTGSIIGYNQATGTFDRTLQGGFNVDDIFVIEYNEVFQ